MRSLLPFVFVAIVGLLPVSGGAQTLDGTVTLNGSNQIVVTLNSAASFQFNQTVTGASGFTMVIDEVYCSDPQAITTTATGGPITYSSPNTSSGSVSQMGPFGINFGVYTIRDEELTVGTPPAVAFTAGEYITFNPGTVISLANYTVIPCMNAGPFNAFIPSDDYSTVAATMVALPVRLSAFEATPTDRRVQLFWQTESESQNQRFFIDRSVDGAEWERLGEVAGAGHSSEARRYGLTDDAPIRGMAWYRLRQEDTNGAITESGMLSVTFDPQGMDLKVWPNPAEDQLTLETDHLPEGQVGIVLRNSLGQEVARYEFVGTNTFRMDVSDLKRGLYFAELSNGHNLVTRSFLLR